jgi:hypothetical protein
MKKKERSNRGLLNFVVKADEVARSKVSCAPRYLVKDAVTEAEGYDIFEGRAGLIISHFFFCRRTKGIGKFYRTDLVKTNDPTIHFFHLSLSSTDSDKFF